MPKLLQQVRQLIRTRHYSIRTEKAYVSWIKDYILFHHKRHPTELNERDIGAWLSYLATKKKCGGVYTEPGSFGRSLPLPQRPECLTRMD